MRVEALVVVGLIACTGSAPPAGTFDLDAGGPYVVASAIVAIQKEPVKAIHNIRKRDELPLFHWDYDFTRWGWKTATLTRPSHADFVVWQFTLSDPIQPTCSADFLAPELAPIAGKPDTFRLVGGPLDQVLLQRESSPCKLVMHTQAWADREER